MFIFLHIWYTTNLFIFARQIVELTQNVNGLGNQMNDLADENEELRERLGLDPKETVDLTDYRNREFSSHIRIVIRYVF